MANQQPPQQRKPEPPQLDEQQLQEAFDHLNDLHAQLRALRTAIPNMIAPLATKQPSPQALFSSFTMSVQESRTQLADFKECITSEKSQKVFRYASESRRANPKNIKPWRATDDPDWVERARKLPNGRTAK
ncbi:hypothetical protein GQ53DRAFT_21988 [Thozetella sp. PMI_491]|nr:hypothetical protein GQ53DRAFT_21988 [Thozetella sp. PMI_491]